MKKLLLILLCLPMIGFGQQTYVPDNWFEAYLENNGIGNGIQYDDSVFTAAIDTVTYLDVSYGAGQAIGIFDLTGIEDFTNLEYLDCSYNLLTSLDVSANTALTTLWCIDNQLTSLDVSNNINLVEFWCSNNPLIALTVKNGNNTNMTCDYVGPKLSCGGLGFISSLSCIEVDDVAWSYTNWVNGPWSVSIDTIFQYFSTNCNPSSIQEHSTNKELLKVTDLLGREPKGKRNQPLFYIYDDGTVEKRIVIE